jgi:hypothetical protein
MPYGLPRGGGYERGRARQHRSAYPDRPAVRQVLDYSDEGSEVLRAVFFGRDVYLYEIGVAVRQVVGKAFVRVVDLQLCRRIMPGEPDAERLAYEAVSYEADSHISR